MFGEMPSCFISVKPFGKKTMLTPNKLLTLKVLKTSLICRYSRQNVVPWEEKNQAIP